MKKIYLTGLLGKNKYTIVDNEDFEKVSKYKWHLDSDGYAVRRALKKENQLGEKVRLHRFLINPPKNMQVDHVNRDKLDNRKENLRICTCIENSRNKGILPNNKSNFTGVCWAERQKKWRAYIWINKKSLHLGYFTSIDQAAIAYDNAAIKYFGEFARTNYDHNSFINK